MPPHFPNLPNINYNLRLWLRESLFRFLKPLNINFNLIIIKLIDINGKLMETKWIDVNL